MEPGGLSPLARGTPANNYSPTALGRFIPAGAGNTRKRLIRFLRAAVYPRWRGEHRHSTPGLYWSIGLSPLARGTRLCERIASRFQRFIPAGAGNTPASQKLVQPGAVYPRWRGEHRLSSQRKFASNGLSPLARGTLICLMVMTLNRRFIPAGAGNTRISISMSRTGAVYPRWRGEHSLQKISLIPLPGLSPLARGTRFSASGVQQRLRFIPAGAGNTCHSPVR